MSQAEIKKALKEFRSLGEETIQKASARALNRVATSVRAEASRRVRAEIALKAADVKDVILIERTKGSKALKSQQVILKVLSRGISLLKYGARPKAVKTDKGPRLGVTVKVKPNGQRKLVTGGFVATLKSGKTAIFKRRTDARLPIRLQFGPSVRDVFRGEGFLRGLLDFARANLAKTLRRELSYEAQKENRK